MGQDPLKIPGNLMYESTDFSIPSLLLNLELTRTYNSQSDKEGMLGKGWYDSFHKELYQLGDDLVFQDSDGTYLTYSPQKAEVLMFLIRIRRQRTMHFHLIQKMM